MRSPGTVNVGGVLSRIVMVWNWSAAVLPQLSIKLQVLLIVYPPSHPMIAMVSVSTKTAWIPIEQLSVSSVTSPVKATLAS